ncbi:MAG: peptide ABC transporter substrate-binding protein [Candidatus Rokubacteria bacterium]|nr:peptide ABC transporter substrate-binding protein [Candidatus Rokubacteria bacterium]MBI3826391.1 peptide ABC transporter substrate-binding protein [Candidatus Rokubacteria bacterium]
MKLPRIPDAQMQLLEERLRGAGVDRRGFLRIAAGIAAMGSVGVNARPASAAPKLAAGQRLAKDQTFRFGGGGFYQNDPASHDFNKNLYCGGVPALFAGLTRFTADLQAVPHVATKITSNADGSVWTFVIRKDSKWSDGSPCTAKDFEWSWKRQMDPASANPYASYFYDIKGAEAFNKKESDASQVAVRAKDDWTLEVTLDGPRGYFPVLAAYIAAYPAHRPSVEKHGDKWTEAGNMVSNGAFTLEVWEHQKQMVLRKNPHFFGAKDVTLEKVVIPIIPSQSGALPYENNELDLTRVQTGDLKRLQSSPKTAEEVFRYPFPGTWYLTPQVTKPPFDNVKVRRAVGHAIDRANVVKVAQGFATPAWSMIPPGFPGALDDPKVKAIQRFDPKAAMAQLKGTPFEGGKNWPKITLTMRDEAYGAKPLAEAVQSVLLEHLNMKTDLEVLEQRVFRERLWKQDLQFVWIRWFMDYPDPHNEYFDTFYGKRTSGRRQAWVNDAFDKELESGRDTRDMKKRLGHYARAEEIMQMDAGYVPVAWVQVYGAMKPWVKGLERNKQGEYVIDGNIYVDMLSHLYMIERA